MSPDLGTLRHERENSPNPSREGSEARSEIASKSIFIVLYDMCSMLTIPSFVRRLQCLVVVENQPDETHTSCIERRRRVISLPPPERHTCELASQSRRLTDFRMFCAILAYGLPYTPGSWILPTERICAGSFRFYYTNRTVILPI